jgi:lysozyme
MGQSITVRQAEQLLVSDVYLIEMMLNAVFRDSLNQNQFDALVSFIFNIGTTRFRHSSLFALIKCNPADPAISAEFAKWVYGGDGQNNGRDDDGDGLVDEPGEKLRLPGLIARRADESNLYFT